MYFFLMEGENRELLLHFSFNKRQMSMFADLYVLNSFSRYNLIVQVYFWKIHLNTALSYRSRVSTMHEKLLLKRNLCFQESIFENEFLKMWFYFKKWCVTLIKTLHIYMFNKLKVECPNPVGKNLTKFQWF